MHVHRFGVASLLLCILSSAFTTAAAGQNDLLTVAESSEYTRTATYDEVIALIGRIDAASEFVRVGSMGETVEGRDIPLMILANPPVSTAQEAHASGKTIVFAFGNIHAGEVCGKEALLMLAREFALDPDHELLDDLVIVLAPIYNADGNERFGPVEENRPGQVGPERVGIRPNAQGLDLNRDYVKLESPEARAMVRFLTEWDPHLTIDCHTTNGSAHRYTLTYAAPLNPSGAAEPIEYVRDVMLPQITERLRERTGYDTFFYGNFNRDHTAWYTYSAHPRYGGPYRGLRGQMSVLSEAYSYAPYKDRVICTREFVREILHHAAENDVRLREIHEGAKRETIERGRHPQPDDVVGIRHRIAAFRDLETIHGFEQAPGEGGRRRPALTGEPKDHEVVHLGRFEPTLSVARPWGYIIEPGNDGLLEKLRQHGVTVEPFTGAARCRAYTIDGVHTARRPFQGHVLRSLDVTANRVSRSFDGAHLVRTAQPLGNLIVYLLEPQSEDGFAAWGNVGDRIEGGREYPVLRIEHPDDVEAE